MARKIYHDRKKYLNKASLNTGCQDALDAKWLAGYVTYCQSCIQQHDELKANKILMCPPGLRRKLENIPYQSYDKMRNGPWSAPHTKRRRLNRTIEHQQMGLR